jgi:hypothetical protein
MKVCFKCGETLPLSAFYAHKQMADGHLNKCKECTKADVANNYRKAPAVHLAASRRRHERYKAAGLCARWQQNQRTAHPDRYLARTATANAIRDGRLTRMPCEVCGCLKSQAHHEDYTKPLEVRWLCFVHHRQAHGQDPQRN